LIKLDDAAPQDLDALALFHWSVWREAYAGIMPPDLVAAPTVAFRMKQWAEVLAWPPQDRLALLARDGAAVAGFVAAGPTDDTDAPRFAAEIYGLYVGRAWRGRGIGADLLRAAARRLAVIGAGDLLVWCLVENAPARAFYSRLGGVEERTRRRAFFGIEQDEVAYGWADIARLG
jgi:ribosomal protein S18 acetylase RimI-like enzyme